MIRLAIVFLTHICLLNISVFGLAKYSLNAAERKTPIYVYENYFDDPEKRVSEWAMRRVSHSNGFRTEFLDPTAPFQRVGSIDYDKTGKETSGLNEGVRNESLLWFWKAKPELGYEVSYKRKSKKFLKRGDKPTIVEIGVKSKYLRTEILEVLGEKKLTHVTEATWGKDTKDIKWLDEIGMPVRIVHVVGKQTRTSILRAMVKDVC